MFQDTSELAENKLLLLYILNSIDMPVTNSHITQIVLENNLINYFALQQYLSELTSSGFIDDSIEGSKHSLKITKSGKDTLELFLSRVSQSKRDTVDNYLEINLPEILNELEITAEYTPSKDSNFMVSLRLAGKKGPLIDIKLPARTKEEAKDMCSQWKENSRELYCSIMELLKSKR
jgi:predicted transcriptional regulator